MLQTPAGLSLFSSRLWLAVAACVAVSGVHAEEIRWRSGPQQTTFKPAGEVARFLAEPANRAPGDRRVVVQFDQPVSRAERAELAAAGVTLLNYVGDNAYFARVDDVQVDEARLATVRPLRAALPIERDWKLHPSLVADEVQPWAIVGPPEKADASDDPMVAAYVLFHADVDLLTEGVAAVRQAGARIHSQLRSVNGLVIELPATQIKPLAEDDRVQYIEPPLPQMSAFNDSNRVITEADVVQAAPYGLDGSGISVLVYDGGTVRATHQDFGGRATVRDTSGTSDHATHVAGTVGGDGSASGGVNRGMAPNVTIESYGFEQPGGLSQGFLYTDPGDIEADYSQAIDVHGVDISNNSIGTNTAPNGFPCSWEGDYGVTSTVIDTIVRGDGSNPVFNSPFRVIWANGNERSSGACGTTYLTTAPPACAKNHITVGALNSNDDSVTGFTSWGPADDGRLKPDISAPGCQSDDDFGVTSLSSSGDTAYTSKCGTSMASPTVCGLAALILQDYRAQFPATPDPRNSTLKVLFAHTAEDIVNTGPDYQTGYGSVRVERAINLMRAENFLEDTVSQGGVFSAVAAVSPSDTELKVTLAWDDVPGTPNVDPALVNDLDLHVYAPDNTRHYPWTLNPASPSNPAVRTQEDHVNNIEQVVVDNPAPGAWRIEIHGFNVPQGPQPFSLSATPLLVNCSDTGSISLDRSAYACASTATLRVSDCGLNTSDTLVETVTVTIASDTEPAGESIVLTETAAETATFVGTIPLATSDAAGTLHVTAGDTVTATYLDADDGQGGTNITVTAQSGVDCTAPVISAVQTTNVLPRSATVTFITDEPATAGVRYGSTCAALTETVNLNGLNTSHSAGLSGLTDSTTYFYAVDAADAAGNPTTDDAGGACYTFTTPDIPDFFTEEFGSGNDLDNLMLTFTPNATVDQYSACAEAITVLPTDPAGGTSLSLSDDDFETVDLTGGAQIVFYGQSYTRFYPASNGYLTLDSGDTDYTESLGDHFGNIRIAPLFDDLNPTDGGTISWKQLADRVAVTWENVPQYNTSGDQNTFQIEMFFDGTIRISYLGIGADDGIAGLSQGLGLDPDFFPTDLSDLGNCGPQPPVATGANVATPANVAVNIVLNGTDDGLPDPPAALSTIVMSLPTKGTLSDPNGGAIAAVPYTLLVGGATVTYTPTTNLYGPDQFNFMVNDGGTPPDGGDSNLAAIGVSIIADPPVAQADSVTVDVDTTSLIVLAATDPNGDPLDYVITALPSDASLADPSAGAIGAVPYTLAGQGNVVAITPDPGYAGDTQFTFTAKDAIFESNPAGVDVFVLAPPPQIITTQLPDGIEGQPYGPVALEKIGGQPATAWSLVTDPIYVESDLGTSGFAEVGVGQGWQGDDQFWNYNLPFSFPFYGQTHSSLRVWSNGMLDFSPHTGSSYVNSQALLISNQRIAPLWDDLRTDQTGGDIFIDESVPQAVTIRWSATTHSGGHAVNMSATLHANGDIDFHYGGGNAPITPTVGVSDGTGSDYTIATLDNATDLGGVNSIRLRIPVSLPAGLSVDPAGHVSGTPTEFGNYQPVVRLADSLQRTDDQVMDLAIIAAGGLPGDYDGDGDVDLTDYAVFVDCLYGPNATPAPAPPRTAASCLAVFDFNADSDVDLQDAGQWTQALTP
jgi:hypothetical protein